MKVIIFGATGMVGQGVLRECLLDPAVEAVLSIGRKPTGQHHAKLRDLAHNNFLDFTPIAQELAGYDACFWCLGVTSAGTSEQDYTRMTYEFTMAPARVLVKMNPAIQSRTKLYRVLLTVAAPLYPLWKALLPNYVTTTEQLGRAMLKVAKDGAPKHVLESRDIIKII
jgi:hypothetical protein